MPIRRKPAVRKPIPSSPRKENIGDGALDQGRGFYKKEDNTSVFKPVGPKKPSEKPTGT